MGKYQKLICLRGDVTMININYNDKLYATKNNRIVIYEGEIDGSKCYIVKHEAQCHIEIIDYDESIITAIINKSKKENSLSITTHRGINSFKFQESEFGKSISLRKFVYATIHGLEPEDTHSMRIEIIDNTLKGDNIIDLRSNNLKHSGADSMEGLEVLCRPEIASEKYLLVERDNTISIQEYSESLLSIFKNHSLCTLSGQSTSNRQLIKFKTSKYITTHLTKFIMIFNQYFIPSSENESDSITEFARDYPELVSETGDLHCAHINARTWNNCINNTMFMTRQDNQDMSDLIKCFTGNYDAFAISYQIPDGSYIILVKITSAFGEKFYICDTPNSYADLQKSYLGKAPALRNTRLNIIDTEKNAGTTIDTPKEAFIKYGKQPEPINRDAFIEAFWSWCDQRDSLIALYSETPDVFQKWNPMIVEHGIRADAFLKNISSGFLPKGILASLKIN